MKRLRFSKETIYVIRKQKWRWLDALLNERWEVDLYTTTPDVRGTTLANLVGQKLSGGMKSKKSFQQKILFNMLKTE